MLDFLIPKEKIQTYSLKEVPIEEFEIIGVGQINPYCSKSYDNEIFLTVINIADDSNKYDEKEGLVVSEYFTLRKCPKCHRIQLIPVKLYLNLTSRYLKYEKNYYNYSKNTNNRLSFPTVGYGYCNSCSSCFEMRLKSKDVRVKQARKIKEKDLINLTWQEFEIG